MLLLVQKDGRYGGTEELVEAVRRGFGGLVCEVVMRKEKGLVGYPFPLSEYEGQVDGIVRSSRRMRDVCCFGGVEVCLEDKVDGLSRCADLLRQLADVYDRMCYDVDLKLKEVVGGTEVVKVGGRKRKRVVGRGDSRGVRRRLSAREVRAVNRKI